MKPFLQVGLGITRRGVWWYPVWHCIPILHVRQT